MANITFLGHRKKESLFSVLGFIAMAFACAGALAAVIGVRSFITFKRLQADGVRTEGIIVQRRVGKIGVETRVHLEFHFTDQQGQDSGAARELAISIPAICPART